MSRHDAGGRKRGGVQPLLVEVQQVRHNQRAAGHGLEPVVETADQIPEPRDRPNMRQEREHCELRQHCFHIRVCRCVDVPILVLLFLLEMVFG